MSKERRISTGADLAALESGYAVLRHIDPIVAEGMLKEIKQIMDQLGVIFFLRQGTCLGAVRDNEFITWDDDLDLGSVIGLHGLTEDSVEEVTDRVVAAFRDSGYFVKKERNDDYIAVTMMKSYVRVDWSVYRIANDTIYHYPGVRIPARLFADLQEIKFKGEKFFVPNPVEKYLSLKYGSDWRTPKGPGKYEGEILASIPRVDGPGQFLAGTSVIKVRVLNQDSNPVPNAEVEVRGHVVVRTDEQGYAEFYLPCEDWYALVIKFEDHAELLYQEKIGPGGRYIYRPDPSSTSGRLMALILA